MEFGFQSLLHFPLGWQDALVELSFDRPEVEYEEAATLYNLGSAHSIVGEQEGRADDNSLKQACTQFQYAAWVFQTLRERYAQFEDANDMHGDLCRFYHSLMLSQAQECVTEKSMLDNRPPALTAKLTKFLVESYDYCWNQLNTQTLASLLPEKFLRDWKRLVLVKKLFYSALTNYFLAMDAAAKMKFGPGVTWLKQADTEITEAFKVAKDASNASNSPHFGAPLLVVVSFAQNVISTSCKGAIKDNDTIYHERVPPLSELDAVKGANVVKPTPFDHTDPEVIGEDIFKDLLPLETLEASSMYSEVKADFLRKILAEVEEKDVALGSFMSSINLDPKDLCKPDSHLPQALLDVCAQLQAMDPPPEGELSSRMKALVNVGVDVESDTSLITNEIQEIQKKLEILKDEKAAKPLTDRLSRIADYHAKLAEAVNDAKHSNTQLNRALTEHLTAVRTLLKPAEEIEADLPSVKEMILDEELLSGLDEAARILEKVNQMRDQRDTLVSELRAAVQADDITRELLTADPADHEAIFEARLKRHDPAVAVLRQNLSAQDNITKALVELNASVAVKKHDLLEQRERRTEEVDSLIRSGESFGELLLKCDEGQDFYKQMSERLQKVHSELTELAEEVERLQPKPEAVPAMVAPIVAPVSIPGAMVPEVPRLGDYLKAKRLAAGATAVPRTASQTPPATAAGAVGTAVPVNRPHYPYWQPVSQPYPQVPGFSPMPFNPRGVQPTPLQDAAAKSTMTSDPTAAPSPFAPYGQVNTGFRAPGKEPYEVPPNQAVPGQPTQLPQQQQQPQTLSRPMAPQYPQYPYQPVAFPAQGGYPPQQQGAVVTSGSQQPNAVPAQPTTQLPQQPQPQSSSRPLTPQYSQYPYQPGAFPVQGGYPLPQQGAGVTSGSQQPQTAVKSSKPLGGDPVPAQPAQLPQPQQQSSRPLTPQYSQYAYHPGVFPARGGYPPPQQGAVVTSGSQQPLGGNAVPPQPTQLPQQQQQTSSRPLTPQYSQYAYQPGVFPAQGAYPPQQQGAVVPSGSQQPQPPVQPSKPLDGDAGSGNQGAKQQSQGAGPAPPAYDAIAPRLINQPSPQTVLPQSNQFPGQQQPQPPQSFPAPSTKAQPGPNMPSDLRLRQSPQPPPVVHQPTGLRAVIGSYPMRVQQPSAYAVQAPPQQPSAYRQPAAPDQARSGPVTPQPPYSHTPPPGQLLRPPYTGGVAQPVVTFNQSRTPTPTVPAPVSSGAPGVSPFVQAPVAATPQGPPVGYTMGPMQQQPPTAYQGTPQYNTGSRPTLQTSGPAPGMPQQQQYPQPQANQSYAQQTAIRPGMSPIPYQQQSSGGGPPSVSAGPGLPQASLVPVAGGETTAPVAATVVTDSATVSTGNAPSQVDVAPVSETSEPKPAADMLPILPQVLTQDDLEVQRREKQLRAAYAAQPQQWNSENADGSTAATAPVATAARSNSIHATDAQKRSLVSNQVDAANASASNQPEHQSLSDPLVLNRFITATERLLSWLEALNAPFEAAIEDGDDSKMAAPQRAVAEKPKTTRVSRLDHAWQRVTELSCCSCGDKRPTLAAARVCAAKNRSQDCVPYDMNRVVLRSLKEDYINASHMDFHSTLGDWCPRYILTQAPLCGTVADFWTMIFEQGCEVVALLLPLRAQTSISTLPSSVDPISGLAEGAYGEVTDKRRVPPHLPGLKVGSRLSIPDSALDLRLQAVKLVKSESSSSDLGAYQLNGDSLALAESLPSATCIERVLTLQNRDTQQTRSIVHLCYTGKFPAPADTASVGALTAFIQSVHGFYKQQRNLMHPIAVACETGCGLGGIFVTASIAMLQAEALSQLADVYDIAGRVCQQRRNALGQASHLAAACATVAQAAVQTLARRDIVVGPKQYRRVPEAEKTRVLTKTPQQQQHPAVNSEGQSRDLADRLFSDQPLNLNELMHSMGSWGKERKCADTSNAGESSVQACLSTEVPARAAEDQQNQEQPQGSTVVKPEPIRAAAVTGEANLFSDLPEHLVNLTLSQQADQAGLAKRHYQARDFVDQEFREVRDKQQATVNQLFQDLDPLRASPAGNQ